MVLWEAARIHPDLAAISYNLACYARVLGNIDEAKALLKRACEMDAVFKITALDDPDLVAIFGRERTGPEADRKGGRESWSAASKGNLDHSIHVSAPNAVF